MSGVDEQKSVMNFSLVAALVLLGVKVTGAVMTGAHLAALLGLMATR